MFSASNMARYGESLLIREWRGHAPPALYIRLGINTPPRQLSHSASLVCVTPPNQLATSFLSFYRLPNPFKLLLRSSLRQTNRLRILFELIIVSGQVHSVTVRQLVRNNFNCLLSKNHIPVSPMRFASQVFR